MRPLVLGTRGSDLALAQTRHVAALLRAAHPGLVVEERIIRTTGDARLDVSLSAPGALDKGLFTRELEEALTADAIDAAVHSLKDLPTAQPPGLALGAVLEREDPADVLIAKTAGGLESLPSGARVATSSLRRACFLRWRRPDLEIVEIRGNVPTRLRKLADTPDLAALVLAAAGLRRLERAGCPLALEGLHVSALDFMLPAPGQGAIAVQTRLNDPRFAAIHHEPTAVSVETERAILAHLGGGCHLPLGALASPQADGCLLVRAAWFGAGEPRTAHVTGPMESWLELAEKISRALRLPG